MTLATTRPRQIDPRGHRFGAGLSVVLLGAGGAWLLAGAVAVLQALLAATGYCLGCRLYFLRWYAPALFDRFIAGTAGEPVARAI